MSRRLIGDFGFFSSVGLHEHFLILGKLCLCIFSNEVPGVIFLALFFSPVSSFVQKMKTTRPLHFMASLSVSFPVRSSFIFIFGSRLLYGKNLMIRKVCFICFVFVCRTFFLAAASTRFYFH